MARRSQGWGRSFAFSAPKDDFSKPAFRGSPGINPRKGSGWGERGGIRVPTLIEAYNRDSDYRRWKAGMELWFGNGKGWVDQQMGVLARLKTGYISDVVPLVTTMFPSRGSAERAWHVTLRPRGAIALPGPLTADRVRTDRGDPDWANHRLILDVRGLIERPRLAVWQLLVGDQFEDSASGPNVPGDLVRRPVDAVAFTLVEVDVSGFRLIFDLSRPFVRKIVGPRTYWALATYNPAAPLGWTLDSSRHLCSSHRFSCSCPDYQGRVLAENLSATGSLSEKFPAPAAGRAQVTPWEAEGIGYSKQWRDLDGRVDRRRECKHIHAVRWETGVPFLEPSDYPTGREREWVDDRSLIEREYTFSDLARFYAEAGITYDRLVLSVAPSIGIQLDAEGKLRGETETFRPVNQPILWTDSQMPKYPWCRQNDWWLERGTQQVYLFDPPSGGFVTAVNEEPVLELVPLDSDRAPVIVA